jgi:hypothetical protein
LATSVGASIVFIPNLVIAECWHRPLDFQQGSWVTLALLKYFRRAGGLLRRPASVKISRSIWHRCASFVGWW